MSPGDNHQIIKSSRRVFGMIDETCLPPCRRPVCKFILFADPSQFSQSKLTYDELPHFSRSIATVAVLYGDHCPRDVWSQDCKNMTQVSVLFSPNKPERPLLDTSLFAVDRTGVWRVVRKYLSLGWKKLRVGLLCLSPYKDRSLRLPLFPCFRIIMFSRRTMIIHSFLSSGGGGMVKAIDFPLCAFDIYSNRNMIR